MKKRIIASILSLMMIVGFVLPGSLSYAAERADVAFTMNDTSAVKPGEDIKVNIGFDILDDAKKTVDIGAFVFSLEYDASSLAYKTGSLSSSVFDGMSIYSNETAGKISFAWESTKNHKVTEGVMFTLAFHIRDDFNGETTVKLTNGSAYSIVLSEKGLTFVDVLIEADGNVNADALVSTGSMSVSDAADKVIQLIDGLGEVTASAEYKQKLETALAAYQELTYAQKQEVSNYQELLDKYNAYQELADGGMSEEATKWLADYADVLALRASTVTVNDKTAIDAALAAWSVLPTGSRIETTRERQLLKSLLSTIEKLFADELERLEQEELEMENRNQYELFKETYAHLLSRTPESLYAEEYSEVQTMNTDLQNMELFYDLAYNWLKEDGTYDHVQELLAAAKKKYDEKYPADAEYLERANNFRDMFGYILDLKPEDVTYDDVADIKTAYIAYEFMDEKSKSYLTDEYAKIEALMEVADILEPEEDDIEPEIEIMETVVEVPGETKTITKLITKLLGSADDYLVSFQMRGVGGFIHALLIMDAVAMVALIGVQLMCYFLKKKHLRNMGMEV